MAEIRVPKLNTNDSAYVLLEWLVADGAPVRGDDVVASVETSKTVEELISGHDGILVQLIPAGADCTPGQPIAHITPHPASPPTPPPPAPAPLSPPPAPAPAPAPPSFALPSAVPSPASGALAAVSGDALPAKAPLITAPAQALIDELGIDPARVRDLPVKVVRRADVE
ncbi:biotin/lipoyl-containing protein, partial [Nonomuraea sp. NPDC003201]